MEHAAVSHHSAGRLARVGVVETDRVARFLQIHSQIEEIDQHLSMALRLHVAAHHAKGHQGLAVLGHEGRNDGVKGALARLEAIGVPRLQREATAAVL